MEPRRRRRVRRHRAVLVRPRDLGVPDRRRTCPRQGSIPPGRHAGPRHGPSQHPPPRSALGLQHEPARGARRAPAVADDRRSLRPEARAARRDLGARPRVAGALLRERGGRAASRPQRALRLLDTGCGDAGDRRTDRGDAPHRRVAALERLQPRRRPVHDEVVRRRRASGARGARDLAHAARHAVALLRGRDRHAERRRPPRPAEGPRRPAPLAGGPGPGQGEDADAVDARGRLLGRRRRAVAPDGRRPLPQRRRPARRPGVVPHVLPGPDRRATRSRGPPFGFVRRGSDHRRASGRGGAAPGRW